VIGDNISTNNTLCCTIKDYLLKEENTVWVADQWQVRCLGYIINLVVQAFLFYNAIKMEELALYDKLKAIGQLNLKETKRRFRLLEPLGQLYNILVHSCSSVGRTEEFLALATRICPLDNRTR
jgi:hypothetical protein